MSQPKPNVFRRRPILMTAVALAGAAAAAAAGIRAYEVIHFTGTMHLDDGSTALVEGDVEVQGGDNQTMNVTAQVPSGVVSSGEMALTLPDGKVVHVIAAPTYGQSGAAKPKPAQPK